MIRPNPLVHEVLSGLSVADRTHSIHLGHLTVQGLVLFLWWPPRNDLYHVLATANPPDTLLAVMIALGVTHAWYSLRAGVEEILLPGQHPLGEWALASPLSLARILRGYLGDNSCRACMRSSSPRRCCSPPSRLEGARGRYCSSVLPG